MPDVTYPSITVRVGYPGVGPAEMEELIVRPLEQALAAVPGLEQMNSTASEGSAQRAAELRVGHGPQRSGRRSAHARRSRPRPAAARGGSAEHLEVRLLGRADHGHRRRGRLRPRRRCARWPSTTWSPRLERVEGVASVTVNGGLRRQIHIELSKEKITALDLSVDRVVSTHPRRKTRTSRSARSTRATRPTCSAARASSRTSTRSATSSC